MCPSPARATKIECEPFDSPVTIPLEPHGKDQTLMTIDHALPPELTADHEQGWNQIAQGLAHRLQVHAKTS